MTRARLYRRMVRRETHSPRSATAIVLAALVVLTLGWLSAELVLALLGRAALLVAPSDAVASLRRLDTLPPAILFAAGAITAVVGLALVLHAVMPGRRGRRARTTSRTVIVVDDRVIASSLAAGAASAARISADQVRVSVARRRCAIEITPTSGQVVDTAAVHERARSEISASGLAPSLRPHVALRSDGVVGA